MAVGRMRTSPDRAEHQIKGTWFISGHRYLEEVAGRESLDRMLAALDPAVRPIVADPLASQWYPEEASLEMLNAFLSALCGGDVQKYDALIEDMTVFGIGRFFRALLKLTTTEFVLRQVPTFWRQLRRGPGHVAVEKIGEIHRVSYTNFPFCEYDVYRVCFRAQLRALLLASVGERPECRIASFGPTHLNVDIRLP